MSKLEIKVRLSNGSFKVEADSHGDIISEIVRAVFKREMQYCRTKSEAEYNTSVLLGMSERNIRRIINADPKTEKE